jgi:hypothetical protein
VPPPITRAIRVGVERPKTAEGDARRHHVGELRPDKEDRHLLPGHRVAGTEVAAAAAAGDSPPGELLDKRTERAASRHVVEHLLARHAGGGLENTQGLGQG